MTRIALASIVLLARSVWAIAPSVLVGVGVGWFLHPGAGLAAGGLVLWLDDLLPDGGDSEDLNG